MNIFPNPVIDSDYQYTTVLDTIPSSVILAASVHQAHYTDTSSIPSYRSRTAQLHASNELSGGALVAETRDDVPRDPERAEASSSSALQQRRRELGEEDRVKKGEEHAA